MGHPINSSSSEYLPWISGDGSELYFSACQCLGGPGRFGNDNMWVTKRTATDGAWGEPENLGPVVNSPYSEMCSRLSPDGRVLFFCGNFTETAYRPGGYGGTDLWMTRRDTLSDPWQAPVNLGPKINSSKHESWPCISPDGSTLYFTTVSGSTWDNWQVPIIPIVDFDGHSQADP
jgi:Tol biopolymer transport system component